MSRKTYRVEIKGNATFVGYVTAESEDEAFDIAVQDNISDYLLDDVVSLKYKLEEM